ncbi:hypothetical protein AB6A40_006912 [Gnathostoma spinigerum]|uniref:Uncharacterized protein n=1 Tax=Gnathostoma spinigerum TaxID=75299 RepID=A0ABD6ET34_9BILA
MRRSNRLSSAKKSPCKDVSNHPVHVASKLESRKRRLKFRGIRRYMEYGDCHKERNDEVIFINGGGDPTDTRLSCVESESITPKHLELPKVKKCADSENILPWVDQLRPQCSNDIIGNESVLEEMRQWFSMWRRRLDRQFETSIRVFFELYSKFFDVSKIHPVSSSVSSPV